MIKKIYGIPIYVPIRTGKQTQFAFGRWRSKNAFAFFGFFPYLRVKFHLMHIIHSTFGVLLHSYSELQSLSCNDIQKNNVESQMVQTFENK